MVSTNATGHRTTAPWRLVSQRITDIQKATSFLLRFLSSWVDMIVYWPATGCNVSFHRLADLIGGKQMEIDSDGFSVMDAEFDTTSDFAGKTKGWYIRNVPRPLQNNAKTLLYGYITDVQIKLVQLETPPAGLRTDLLITITMDTTWHTKADAPVMWKANFDIGNGVIQTFNFSGMTIICGNKIGYSLSAQFDNDKFDAAKFKSLDHFGGTMIPCV